MQRSEHWPTSEHPPRAFDLVKFTAHFCISFRRRLTNQEVSLPPTPLHVRAISRSHRHLMGVNMVAFEDAPKRLETRAPSSKLQHLVYRLMRNPALVFGIINILLNLFQRPTGKCLETSLSYVLLFLSLLEGLKTAKLDLSDRTLNYVSNKPWLSHWPKPFQVLVTHYILGILSNAYGAGYPI